MRREEGFNRIVEFRSSERCNTESGVVRVDGVVGGDGIVESNHVQFKLSCFVLIVNHF